MRARPGTSSPGAPGRRELDHRGAAAACRRVDRAADTDACRADRQAAARGDPPPVRLARDRPGRAAQPGRVGARADAHSEGARRRCSIRRSAAAARQHRCDDADRPARPRADRADGVFVRARRRGARRCGSRTSTCSTGACGCGCAKKAASGTRCPATTTLEAYLHAYLDGSRHLRDEPKGPLFRTIGARHRPAQHARRCRRRTRMRWCGAARSRPASPRRSATTRSARPASPPI